MKFLKVVAGTLLLVVGVSGSMIAAIAIADPVGTKLAEDADPFGPPATLTQSLTLLGIYVAVATSGMLLLLRRRSHENH